MQQGDFSKEVEQLLNPVRDKKCLLGTVHATLEGVDADSLTGFACFTSIQFKDQ